MTIRPAQVVMVLFDALLINLVMGVSYWLRFDGAIPGEYLRHWEIQAVVITIIRITVFRLFGLYRSLWAYASTSELVRIFLAVTASTVFIEALRILSPTMSRPRGVSVLAWGLCLITTVGIRFSLRLARELRSKYEHNPTTRVLVVGAGDAGVLVVREMKKDGSVRRPVAFVDDNPSKTGMLIQGVPVLGTREKICSLVGERNIDEIIIAMPSASRSDIRGILNICQSTGVPVRLLPGVYEIINGKVSINHLRKVSIEDLLGREPVQIDLQEIAKYLKGERILVTGAGGSIGSELSRQIVRFQPETLILLGRGENSIYEINKELQVKYPHLSRHAVVADVRDTARMDEVFARYRPTVVFHAAAHKHVPLMEDAPCEAVKNNVFGTRNVAALADKHGVKRFLLISTDKAVNPTSIMGASKRLAEFTIQEMAKQSKTKYCAVRFGNVLGSRGSVVPLFSEQIAQGGPVTVTHAEMTRYFMTIPEAVSLVIQAGAMGDSGEIFVLDMGEPVKIIDLAQHMVRLSGYEPGIDIKIEVTGLRPGEKLYEELFTASEGTRATKHERIFIANAVDMDIETLCNGNTPLQTVARLVEHLEGKASFDVQEVASSVY